MKKAFYYLLLIIVTILMLLCGMGSYSLSQVISIAEPTRRPPVTPPTYPETGSDCLAVGGNWTVVGMASTDMCEMPVADAGNPCTDSSECEGGCLGNNAGFFADIIFPNLYIIGECSPTNFNGTGFYVEDGKFDIIILD